VQSRLTLISGARDDLLLEEFERCRNDAWVDGLLARHAQAPALPLPASGEPMDADTLVRHVEHALKRPLYWLDLTRADVGIPVVRALMPGLRTLGMERRYYCLREAQA
jgi:ribosomal protein S12 methylthiotransferase accessory factor